MQTGGKFKFRQLSEPSSRVAAPVSRRNQPRTDNNEIHKSVREHVEHPAPPRPGTPRPLSLSRVSSGNGSSRLSTTFTLNLCLRDPRPSLIANGNVFMTLHECRARPGYIIYIYMYMYILKFCSAHRNRTRCAYVSTSGVSLQRKDFEKETIQFREN